MIRIPIPPPSPSSHPCAVAGRMSSRATAWVTLTGLRSACRILAVLDSGGECCLFPAWVAWRIGLKQRPSSPVVVMGSSVSRTGFAAWFDRVNFQLEDPDGLVAPIHWSAMVGFTPAGTFGGSVSGILGVNGGLDQFQRVEFDWSALGGPEVVVHT